MIGYGGLWELAVPGQSLLKLGLGIPSSFQFKDPVSAGSDQLSRKAEYLLPNTLDHFLDLFLLQDLHKGTRLDYGFRVDLIVESAVILDLKSCDKIEKIVRYPQFYGGGVLSQQIRPGGGSQHPGEDAARRGRGTDCNFRPHGDGLLEQTRGNRLRLCFPAGKAVVPHQRYGQPG